ncbi:MAG: hypothetical protein ACD_63C00093G0004 [uncultured bacterium]|nr:MAG: hypothetical protein ACD_63C00093G0004 [uncultured bacterium]
MGIIFVEKISENPAWIAGLALVGIVLIAAGLVLLFIYRKKVTVHELLDTVLLLVTVPKEVSEKEEEAKKQEKELISVAEQMYSGLGSLLSQKMPFLTPKIHFTLELASYKKEIFFYVNTPRKFKDYIEKLVHAQHPKAVIEIVKDYNIFFPRGVASAAQLKLRSDSMMPIRTYQKLESDPLNSMTTILSKLGDDEGAVIQVVFRMAPKTWRMKGLKFAHKMVEGKRPLGAAFSDTLSGAGQAFGRELGSVSKTGEQIRESMERERMEEEKLGRLSPLEEEKVKSIEEKANKTSFETKIRIVTSSVDKESSKHHLDNILNAFSQFDVPELNGFIPTRIFSERKIINDYVFRKFGGKAKMILNTEELTSIYHLPIRTTETPSIKRLEAKQAPAPASTPREGVSLGLNVYRGQKKDVKIKDEDRMRHMYIIGRTGTGKSVLLVNLALYNIKRGDGVCIVDPHGELVEDLLQHIPKERVEDIIIFDPSDVERPLGLNMLDYDQEHPEQKDFVVAEMIRIFEKLFPPEMIGPMFEHYMRNVMLTLLEDKENQGTITDIPRMFTDEAFQKYKLKFVKDPIVRSFWEKEMAKTSDFHKSEMLGYLVSKVGRFVENSMMRNIIGQPQSAFDIRNVMDSGKILMINLSKGKVGEINSSLLGLIIVSKIQMAALSRADMPADQRRDFYLYIDEFQNFVTDSVATILAEARKYRLSLTMAHQYIAQLAERSEAVRDSVFGNVGTVMSLRIGAADAEFMEKEFSPVFDQHDLINIDKYNAYVKMIIDNKPTKPFNVKLYSPPKGGDMKVAEAVKELSRLKYGKEKHKVEEDINRRSKLGEAESNLTPTLGSLK